MKRFVCLLLLTASALAHTMPQSIRAFIKQAKENMQASAVVVAYDTNGSRYMNNADLARALRFEPARLLYPLWLSTVKSPDLIDDLTPYEVFETLKRYRIPYRYETDQAAYAYKQGYSLRLGVAQLVRIYGELPYRMLYVSKELSILQTEQNIHRPELLRLVSLYRHKSRRIRRAIEKLEYERSVLPYISASKERLKAWQSDINASLQRYKSRLPHSSVTLAKQGDIVVGVLVLHATFPVAGYRYESDYLAQSLLELLSRVSQDDSNRSIASSIQ